MLHIIRALHLRTSAAKTYGITIMLSRSKMLMAILRQDKITSKVRMDFSADLIMRV